MQAFEHNLVSLPCCLEPLYEVVFHRRSPPYFIVSPVTFLEAGKLVCLFLEKIINVNKNN